MNKELKYLQSLEKFGINLGLDRINFLLERLGNPHLKFKSIHVAGTNGKGSTCAIIASILKEAGYKVGLYTSPHLFDYTERIQINGQQISKAQFSKGLSIIKKIAASPLPLGKGRSAQRKRGEGFDTQPTVFEVLTAVAFWYFAKEKVDYAVIEVGLGGRLDATNVITPLVSVITNIDYEHTAILGETLSKIAAEKAAIIKPGVPVITAERKTEPLKVIEQFARQNNALLLQVMGRASRVTSHLNGKHQRINEACAIVAVRLAGIKISRQDIIRGLRKVRWPGRFQIISKRPLTIMDGAHNPAGIRVLVDTLREQYPGQKFTFIFGTQQDKDSAAMLNLLRPLARKIVITHSSHQNAANKDSISLFDALKQTVGDDRVITGSLFLVADALKLLDVAAEA